MGKGEMETARAEKPPSLPRELRTPLVYYLFAFSANVKPGAEVVHSIELTPTRSSRRSVIAAFNSDQLSDVTGMSTVSIIAE
jgi:hypothetical protein